MTDSPSSSPVFNAYIDGFNLYKGILETRPALKWLDLMSFCAEHMPDMKLQTVYYFTAPVKERFAGDDAPRRQEKYLRVLSNQGIKVVRGKFRKDPKWLRLVSTKRTGVIEPVLSPGLGFVQRALDKSAQSVHPDSPRANVFEMEEKGSDVNLASYLLRDSYSKDIDGALIITGDSDLTTPINFATTHGIQTKVIVPNRNQPCEDLRKVASDLFQLHPEHLASHQLEKVFVTPKGRQIVRPKEWS